MKTLILLLFTVLTFTKSTLYIGTASSQIVQLSFENGIFSLLRNHQNSRILNPTWLTLSQDKQIMFAVRETSPGFVSSFSVDLKLNPMDTISSNGSFPCHTVIHKDLLFISNYLDGILSIVRFDKNGKFTMVQVLDHKLPGKKSHAHQTVIDNNFVFVVDLGSNVIHQYEFNENGLLSPNKIPKVEMRNNCGPRQLVIHSDIDYGYVMCELDATVSILRYNRKLGQFSYLKYISSLRERESSDKMFPAEIKLLDNRIYLSNRDLSFPNLNRNSIAYFNVIPSNGDLKLIQHVDTLGIHPRHFTIINDYLLVANRDSDNIVSFKLDKSTGRILTDFPTIFNMDDLKPTFILDV